MTSTTDNTVETWLRDWFHKQAPDITLQAGQNYFDLGVIDSFGAIELIEDVETHFSIRFSEHDFQDRRFGTLDGLVGIIHEKLGS